MKVKKMNHLHWLLMLFVTTCESMNVSHNNHYSSGKSVSSDYRERSNQLRRARSSPNQTIIQMSPLNSSASSLHKVAFLPEDSFEPTKRQYTHQHHHSKGSKQSNIKRDLSEPIGFLNAVVNDHATSSTNQDSDTVQYPPNKAYKSSSSSEPQSFSRRQRDFSESPISNPTSSASDTNESMNADDHESDSGSPFSSNGSSSSGSSSSHADDSPADSNEDGGFPSAPSSSGPSSASSSSASASNMDEETPVSYDNFGPASVDDEHHARGNSLDEDEQHSSHHLQSPAPQSLSSRLPNLPYSTVSGTYGLSPFMPPAPQMSSPYRSAMYPGGPPPIGSFPGYRPISSPSYPLISSASNSPMAGSYKAMSSESYPAGPMTAKYRTYGSPASSGSSSFAGASGDESGAMYSPFSFDSFPASSDNFGSTPTNFGFKSSSSYGDLMGLNNNNWYLNQQQYLPLMMKQAGYPMMPANGYGMQYQTTTQPPAEEANKDKDKETNGSKTKNRLRFNLNRLQAIRLNNLKLPSIFNWHKNSTTTTPSSIN